MYDVAEFVGCPQCAADAAYRQRERWRAILDAAGHIHRFRRRTTRRNFNHGTRDGNDQMADQHVVGRDGTISVIGEGYANTIQSGPVAERCRSSDEVCRGVVGYRVYVQAVQLHARRGSDAVVRRWSTVAAPATPFTSARGGGSKTTWKRQAVKVLEAESRIREFAARLR